MPLDLDNPPKYCPQCENVGLQTKVKKFRMRDGSLVLMCKSDKCPWPFSEYTKEEVTLTEGGVGAEKKRKKDEEPAQENKKQRIEHVIVQDTSWSTPVESNLEAREEQPVLSEVPAKPPDSPKPSVLLDDRDYFKAIPTAVRQPIKLPKHAAHILDSRIAQDSKVNLTLEDESEGDSCMEEDEMDQDELDLEGSDSELESLVSECSSMSSMSTISESSIGSLEKGAGKLKKRGKKKKRKDRRKQHTEKCSKEMSRGSDIVAVFSDTQSMTSTKTSGPSEDLVPALTEVVSTLPEVVSTPPEVVSTPPEVVSKPPEVVLKPPEVVSTPPDVFSTSTEVVSAPSVCTPSPDLTRACVQLNEKILKEVLSPVKAEKERPSSLGETLYQDEELELNYISNPEDIMRIGSGNRCAQFSFRDSVTGDFVVFPPVFIFETEVEHLYNVLVQQVDSFKKKAYKVETKSNLESRFVVSRSILDGDVVRHIGSCFTKRGMKIHKIRKMTNREKIVRNKAVSSTIDLPNKRREESASAEDEQPGHQSIFDPLETTADETEDPISVFKKPHEPGRSYHSPRQGFSPSSKSVPSPRHGFPSSPGHSGRPPKYCLVLSDPMSPMPATPKDAHQEEEDEEETATEQSSDTMRANNAGQGKSSRGLNVAKRRYSSGLKTSEQSIIPDDNIEDISYDHIAEDEEEGEEEEEEDGLSNFLEMVPSPPPPPSVEREEPSSPDLVERVEKVLMKQNLEVASLGRRAPQKKDTTIVDSKSTLLKSLSNHLMLSTGIDITATVLPEELTVNIPTLALVNFEDDDPDFSLVRKIGTGTDGTFPVYLEQPPVEGNPPKSNCVFHVAQNMSINLPRGSDNLEIKESGSNKIYLTAASDQIEVHNLRGDADYINPNVSKRGRKKKRPVATFGQGWFTWKDWKVNVDLISDYIIYLEKLSKKWKLEPYDALILEKSVNPGNSNVCDFVDFYLQVFTKVLHLKSLYQLDIPESVDFVRARCTNDNVDFFRYCEDIFRGPPVNPRQINLKQVLSTGTIERLINPLPPPENYFMPLPPMVMAEMMSSVSESNPIKTEMTECDRNSSVQTSSLNPGPRPSVTKVEARDIENHGTSVAIIDSVHSLPPSSRIGQGNKCLQFFFENPIDGTRISFKPVYVRDDDDVNCVVALVSEKAGDYKHKIGLIKKPVLYYSQVVRAKSKLEPEVVRYIERCFTKRGMKELRADYRRRTFPDLRRKVDRPKCIVKNETSLFKRSVVEKHIDSEEEFEELCDIIVHNTKEDCYNSDEDDSKQILEERIFGGRLPQVKPKRKATRRGKKNLEKENIEDFEPGKSAVMSAVDYMLDAPDTDSLDSLGRVANKLKLSSLIKAAKRRPKPRRVSSSSSCSDEDFFECRDDYFQTKESGNVRTSDRLKTKYSYKMEPESEPHNETFVGQLDRLDLESMPLVSPKRKVTFKERLDIMIDSKVSFSRPVSTADHPSGGTDRPASVQDRPESQSSRPGSSLMNKSRKHFGFTIDSIEEPDRDSPVLTPRSRHHDKIINESKCLTPRTKSPIGIKPIPDKNKLLTLNAIILPNVSMGMRIETVTPGIQPITVSSGLKETGAPGIQPITASKETTTTEAQQITLSTLQKFDQINVRKSKQKKVSKILEKQKRKAEKNEKKKLRGFGQKKDDAPEKAGQDHGRVHVKKAQVTKEESDLIVSLLREAEEAVIEQKTMVERVQFKQTTAVEMTESHCNAHILDFEEAHGMGEPTVNQDIDEILSGL